MRPLIPLVLLAVAWCSAAAPPLPAQFASDDGALTLFLDEGVSGAHLMIGYGFLVPLEVAWAGDTIEATIGTDVAVAGVFDGDTLLLTLRQGDAEETRTLSRRSGGVTAPDDAPLLAMLAFVPDTANARLGGLPGVGFVDLGAAQDLAAAPRPGSPADLDAMADAERARWMAALRRLQTGPPDVLMGALPMIASMDDLLGFRWSEIEGAIGYGQPPTLGMVIAAEVGRERVAEGLTRRGFASTEVDGVTVWHRGEDGRASLGEREPGDPFVGPLGMAARIAMLPGHLVGTRFWPMTREAVATARGRYPSLADAPDYRTLARAALSTDGALIQAQFLGPLDVGYVADDPFALLRGGDAPARDAPVLPPFGLAVLVDLQDGPDQVSLIALLYPDADAAAAAAEVLAGRLTRFVAETIPTSGARVEPPRVYGGEDGLAAAVAAIRSPPHGAAEGGAAYARWLQAVARRGFELLRWGP